MLIKYWTGEDGEYNVINIPAIGKAQARDMVQGRCGHDFDCCGCFFVRFVSRRLFGLFSITSVGRNV